MVTMELDEVLHLVSIMFDSVARNNYVHNQNIGIGINGESYSNKIYNNIISDSKYAGIDTSEKSSNNKIYNNTITDSPNGIVVKTGASENIFHDNKILNVTENGIVHFKENSYTKTKTDGNKFENNRVMKSKVNANNSASLVVNDVN